MLFHGRKALGQAGEALAGLVVFYGRVQGARFAHKDDQLFAARYARIDKVALQEYIVLHHDRNDHSGVFRAL